MIEIHAELALAGLQRLNVNLQNAARDALREAAGYALALARETPLFRNRTGALRQSIRLVESGQWRYRVIAGGRSAPYAVFVHNGTRPHAIEARRRKFLRFIQNGHVRFAKRVWHPGTAPRPFMKEARDDAEQAIVRFVQSSFNEAIG